MLVLLANQTVQVPSRQRSVPRQLGRVRHPAVAEVGAGTRSNHLADLLQPMPAGRQAEGAPHQTVSHPSHGSQRRGVPTAQLLTRLPQMMTGGGTRLPTAPVTSQTPLHLHRGVGVGYLQMAGSREHPFPMTTLVGAQLLSRQHWSGSLAGGTLAALRTRIPSLQPSHQLWKPFPPTLIPGVS